MTDSATAVSLETQRLSELEVVIERGLETFVEVGNALLEIRQEKLYRLAHQTFEDYCSERWGFTDRRARHYIEAAEIGTMVPVANERQARELAPLKDQPETMAAAWDEAVKESNGRPTAEVVREVVAKRRSIDVHMSSDRSDWATPQDFFLELDREFGFTLDVCATAESAKCERFFSPADDGLAQDWQGVCFMNPPYGDEIPRWVEKAWEASKAGATVVCLVPARVDTGWWWDFCRYGEVRFMRGRLKFGGAETSAPFPSAVVVFAHDRPANVIWWER